MANQNKQQEAAKFGFFTAITLDNMGQEHKNDYLKFEEVTFKEAQDLADANRKAEEAREELEKNEASEAAIQKQKEQDNREATEQLIELLRKKFITGQVYNERTEETVEGEVTDLENLPMRVVTKAARELSGGVDENLNEQ